MSRAAMPCRAEPCHAVPSPGSTYQPDDDGVVAHLGCGVQRGHAVIGAHVGVSPAVLHQVLDDLQVALLAGEVQRGGTGLGLGTESAASRARRWAPTAHIGCEHGAPGTWVRGHGGHGDMRARGHTGHRGCVGHRDRVGAGTPGPRVSQGPGGTQGTGQAAPAAGQYGLGTSMPRPRSVPAQTQRLPREVIKSISSG